jgi:IclR family transcriptional regulator, acetate operon repressor
MRDDAVSVRGTKGYRTPASGTVSADRVADVLLTFAGTKGSLGVSEISRRLGLSKAVVYRILRSLVSRRLLSVDEAGGGRYRLGPAAATLGARALRDLDLRENALPVLRRLQHESGETATVSELVGVSRVYLDQVSSLKEIKMTVEIGRPFPLHAGASSRTILAFASPDLRTQILDGPLEALTPKTIVDRAELEAKLARNTREGVAASFGERQRGAASVAAPLLASDGHAIGSISVCGPVDRFGEETVRRLKPLVRDAAREVSRELGWEEKGDGGG